MRSPNDEIERLREAMRLMYAHYHADNGAELVATYEKAMRDEIELLREELRLVKRQRDAWHADAIGLDYEDMADE